MLVTLSTDKVGSPLRLWPAGLESARLTIGNRGVWCAWPDSNRHCAAFKAAVSTSWTTGALVGSVGFEPTLDTV
jgi:hypothetical protein